MHLLRGLRRASLERVPELRWRIRAAADTDDQGMASGAFGKHPPAIERARPHGVHVGRAGGAHPAHPAHRAGRPLATFTCWRRFDPRGSPTAGWLASILRARPLEPVRQTIRCGWQSVREPVPSTRGATRWSAGLRAAVVENEAGWIDASKLHVRCIARFDEARKIGAGSSAFKCPGRAGSRRTATHGRRRRLCAPLRLDLHAIVGCSGAMQPSTRATC